MFFRTPGPGVTPRLTVCLRWLILMLTPCLAPWLSPPALAQAQAGYAWLEGEAPATITPAATKTNISGWGHPDFLSDEKWMQISIAAEDVDKQVPPDGILLNYPFQAPKDATYDLWNRIGFEFVRSPFDWRVDNGDWKRVSSDQPTTDLMELATWAEVAWLKMGSQTLTAGQHTLQIRLPITKDNNGKTARILYASDALLIDSQPFYPNSKYKPGESRSDPIDQQAAGQVFHLPTPGAGQSRAAVDLKGPWQVARNDELLPPPDVATPMQDIPPVLNWTGIDVPGNKNDQRPDLLFAHRLWYRTRVDVPAGLAGRSFYLTFPQNNLNTTVYVNGVYCGFSKNPFARFSIDVTKAVKPGQVNDVWVGIRDAYYGYTNDPKDPMVLRRAFNIPIDWTGRGFQRLAYPVWSHFDSGILVTPTFSTAGPVYASDVFVRPSVARKELSADVTVSNPGGKAVSGEVVCQAVDPKTGEVAHSLPAAPFTVGAGAEKTVTVTGAWTNPRLWWPDSPELYNLRTALRVDGRSVDTEDTSFGFREWTIDGINFKLNGVNFHGWEDQHSADNPTDWLAFQKSRHEQMMRFWGTNWYGMPPEQALDFFDSNGVVVRRQGILDGEGIGYMAIEENPDLKEIYHSDLKMDLLNNWRDQVVAQVKGERNHPSVMIWSIENEWLFINCINLYGGLMDQFEAVETNVSNAVMAADPTRPTMSDGGAATKAQTLPVCGNHYIDGPPQAYPTLAYTPNITGGGRGRWIWDQKRPRIAGEDFYMTGNHPELVYFGGEEAFQGKASTLHANALWERMLQEGYRWEHFGGWAFWEGQGDTDGSQYISYSPRAVFCRQWDWTFGSGQKIRRSLGIFNDAHSNSPITFKWTLQVGGKTIATHQAIYNVPAGTDVRFDVTLPMPQVTQREEGHWYLALDAEGKRAFTDDKEISVLPDAVPAARKNLGAAGLLVYDPYGTVVSYLRGIAGPKLPFTAVQSLDNLPNTGKVLIIGKDALTPEQSTSSALAAYASAGRTVIVLEQKNPLRYQALPAAIEPAENDGRTAFAEDLSSPALAGLRDKDFFTWGPAPLPAAPPPAAASAAGGPARVAAPNANPPVEALSGPDDQDVVYRNAYLKPTSGARSLVECDNLLQNSALVEVPVGRGLILLSQLLIGEKLPTQAVPRQLLANLVDYGASYKQVYRPVTLTGADNPQLDSAVETIGVHYNKVEDPLAAITPPGNRIAIINASPETLKTLVQNLPKVDAFRNAGGWIVLNNLTPEGIEDYNRLVGVNHLIRKFGNHPSVTNHGSLGVERVMFTTPRNPLSNGIPTGDLVMYSSIKIFPWTEGNFVSPDVFSYVVDYDEVAPFGDSPFFAYGNITNGFVTADGWPLIINFPPNKDGSPYQVPITLPRPEALTDFTWVGNTLYWPTTRVNLVFDGDQAHKLQLPTQPNDQPQSFSIAPPRTAKQVTLEIAKWDVIPGKGGNVGIDNIYLKAKRSPEFYAKVKPLTSPAGLVAYPQGKGGILLCNLLFKADEDVPENATHKRNVLAMLLRNLQAPFAGKTIIAGAALHYTPINISKQATQFRGATGWFGDKAFTMEDLPTGNHVFAGVPYDIYDFPTSPVPTVVMLGGPRVPNNPPQEVRGIPINTRSDALFFLQTARIDRTRSQDEIKQNRNFELFDYVVHYADGQDLKIPVYSEINIANYHQASPTPIPGAQIAWTRPYPGSDQVGVVYSMQWNNPRPDVAIQSIDMQYGPDKVGVPALLALTAATVEK